MAEFTPDEVKSVVLNARKFEGADLRDIDLRGADLIKANLSGADLEGAYLVRANLNRANLSGANLDGAIGVDFSGAKNVPARYLYELKD